MTLPPETIERLQDYARAWRTIAAPVGPLHAAWDWIIDAEMLIAGKKPSEHMTMTNAAYAEYLLTQCTCAVVDNLTKRID